jgi:hypothetical protein
VRRHRGLALQTFCSFVRLLEQHGVSLRSSCALGDEAEKDFAGIKSCLRGPSSDLSSHDGFRGDVRTGSTTKSADCSTRDGFVLTLFTGTRRCPALDDRNTHGLSTGSSGSGELLTSHDHDRLVTT